MRSQLGTIFDLFQATFKRLGSLETRARARVSAYDDSEFIIQNENIKRLFDYDPDQDRDEDGKWTDGGGSSKDGEDKGSGGSSKASSETVKDKATKVSKMLGYPPELLEVSDQVKEFSVNGVPYKAAGEAYLESGKIVLYNNVLSEQAIEGVMAHEIEHHKFESAIKGLSSDTSDLIKSGELTKWIRADGTLRKDVDAKEFERKWPYYFHLNQDLNNTSTSQMAKDDGVSKYSRDWWDAWNAGNVRTDQAMHETLAEISRIHWETGRVEGSKDWRRYYKAVNRLYSQKKNGIIK